jgi:hypothetical protein
MRFLMLVCTTPDDETEDEATAQAPAEQATVERTAAAETAADAAEETGFPWLNDLMARGIWVTGDQLRPPAEGRTVRVRDGQALFTDGPFAETKEVIIGFDILECASLDEAVQIAAAHPVAEFGAIEVRAFLNG